MRIIIDVLLEDIVANICVNTVTIKIENDENYSMFKELVLKPVDDNIDTRDSMYGIELLKNYGDSSSQVWDDENNSLSVEYETRWVHLSDFVTKSISKNIHGVKYRFDNVWYEQDIGHFIEDTIIDEHIDDVWDECSLEAFDLMGTDHRCGLEEYVKEILVDIVDDSVTYVLNISSVDVKLSSILLKCIGDGVDPSQEMSAFIEDLNDVDFISFYHRMINHS